MLLLATVFLRRGLPLGVVGLGVVSGAVLSLSSVGIVLLYSRTRILSFAQFGLGAGAAVFFYLWVEYNQWAVLANGVCGCLAPPHSSMYHLQHNPDPFRRYLEHHHFWVLVVNAMISAALAVLLAADTGKNVYNNLNKAFARAPRIVPTIATLAFAFILGNGAVGLIGARNSSVFGVHLFSWFPYGFRKVAGANPDDPNQQLPEGTFTAPLGKAWQFHLDSGARFHFYDVLAVLIAGASLALVGVLFRRGRRGMLSRAAADSPDRAAALGIDVEAQSRRPWRVAGALSGLAGILSVAMSGTAPLAIDVGQLTRVLAAVVLARLASPAIAVAASVMLSVLDQALFYNFGSHTQFEASLVVIIGVALTLQRSRTTRAERDAASTFSTAAEPLRVPPALRNARGVKGFLRAGGAVAAIGFLVYPLLTDPGQLSLGNTVLSYIVIGLSLLILSGWAGQVSLGQFAFAAIGAYVTAIAAASAHIPFPLSLVFGGLAGAVVAALVGLPALRLPGPFVVIMTLAFSLAVPAIVFNPEIGQKALPSTLQRPVLLGLDLSSDRNFYYTSLVVLLGVLGMVTGLRRGRLRRVLIAGRDNPQAAQSLGIDILRLRLEGFAVAGFVAGLGGGLLAYALRSVQSDTFSSGQSIVIFLIVIIGGLSAVSGPVLGGVVYGLVQLAGSAWLGALNGLGTLIVLTVRPGGLASVVFALRDATIRIILQIQGADPVRARLAAGAQRIGIADRGARASIVPADYRLVGTGWGPVEGTRLRPVAGLENRSIHIAEEHLSEGPLDRVDASAVLDLHRGEISYGGVAAVTGVTLALEAGEIMAVVGTNGAGKTSLLRGIAGLEPLSHGVLTYAGDDISTLAPHLRARAGIGLVTGGAGVFPTLTVRENLDLATEDPTDPATVAQVQDYLARFPALQSRIDTLAGNLSGGEQQVLGLVQASLRQPRVLLVDELSLGLSPQALGAVLDLVRDIAFGGAAVILVEQSISTAMDIADTAMFLDNGVVRYSGRASDLRDHPELFASIAFGATGTVGGGRSEVARAAAFLGDRETALQIEGVTAGYGGTLAVKGVTLSVLPGEIVGILGPNGAGKTSLFDCLSGTLALTEGSVTLLGTDVSTMATDRRARLGLMRSYQNVRLFPSLTVRDCVAVALETRLKVKSSVFSALWLPPARAEERRVDTRVDALLELLALEKVQDTPVGSVSLGTRRLVDLACQLAARPKVLLLDEPTSGMAQGETESLGPLIGRISKDLDCAVLIVEHNISVLASVAQRLVAMNFGEVIADGDPDSVLSDPAVRTAYFGSAEHGRSGSAEHGPSDTATRELVR